MRWREDLQGRFEGSTNELSGLVARDKKCSVLDIVLDLGLGSECCWRRILLENDQKRSERIAR